MAPASVQNLFDRVVTHGFSNGHKSGILWASRNDVIRLECSVQKYSRKLCDDIWIISTAGAHALALENLQKVVFPTLADAQRFKAAHYQKHIDLFSDGQFIAVKGEQVIGMTTSVRKNMDFKNSHHNFDDIFCGGWLTSHNPNGRWLYGADIGVHPDFRGRGIARGLYHARQATVNKLNLMGQVTVGMLSGFGSVKEEVSLQNYFEELVAGTRLDPTVTPQQKVGFEIRGLVPNYIDDPVCSNCGVLLTLDANVCILKP